MPLFSDHNIAQQPRYRPTSRQLVCYIVRTAVLEVSPFSHERSKILRMGGQ